MKRWLPWILLTLAVCTFRPAQVDGQRPVTLPVRPVYTYPNPYYQNPYYNAGTGYGNYLSGGADLNRSFGDVAVKNEEARQIYEKTKQMRLDTKKMAFDQMLYEKAHTPTYLETLTQEKARLLTRIMSYPTPVEVAKGTTLNLLLPHLQALTTFGAPGPPVALPQPPLAALNVSISGNTSVGLFRNGGRFQWPVGLQGPQQKKLDKLLPSAYQETLKGSLGPKLLDQVRAEMKSMREDLRERMLKELVAPSAYMQGIEFFSFLEASVNALERPDARKQLDGSFAPRGHNVQELVEYMTDTGLKFAPAVPGTENAYQTVHDAFVRYARTVQASAGFQPASPPAPFKKS